MRTWRSLDTWVRGENPIKGKRILMQFDKSYDLEYRYTSLVVVLPDTSLCRQFIKQNIANIPFIKLPLSGSNILDYVTHTPNGRYNFSFQRCEGDSIDIIHAWKSNRSGYWLCTGETFGDIIIDIEHYTHKSYDIGQWRDINYETPK